MFETMFEHSSRRALGRHALAFQAALGIQLLLAGVIAAAGFFHIQVLPPPEMPTLRGIPVKLPVSPVPPPKPRQPACQAPSSSAPPRPVPALAVSALIPEGLKPLDIPFSSGPAPDSRTAGSWSFIPGAPGSPVSSGESTGNAGGGPLPPSSITPPKLILRVDPVYPEAARVIGLSGRVVVQIVIDQNGHVSQASVVSSSSSIFNRPALAAVKQWKYTRPINGNGQVVSVYEFVTVRFELR